MKKFLFVLALGTLSACTPFVEVGVGYALDGGSYGFDEKGALGRYGVGFEYEERWYLPTDCGIYHRSMLTADPEIVTNDFDCTKRWIF
jgi:hypothetical protein